MKSKMKSNGKRRFLMDYIEDKEIFKAVMFARKLMRQGKPARKANYIAAHYYGVSISDVAHYTGQTAGTYAGRQG